MRRGDIELHKRTPFGPFWFSDEPEACLQRSSVCLLGITGNAGADYVFPSGWTFPILWDYMIQIQIPPFKHTSAILAGISIPLENIMTGKLDLLLRQSVEKAQQNDSGNADTKRHGADAIGMRFAS